MKAVTGTPRHPDTFGARITGADAAKVTYIPVLAELHQKCAQLLEAYGSQDYKERFGFIDDLKIVRDRPRIAHLNARLLERLNAGDFNVIHMAPPEIVELKDIEFFVFDQFAVERRLSIDVEFYCQQIGVTGQVLSVELLRKGEVGVTYRGSDEIHPLWTVYDCIVAEIPEGNKLFILSGGTWYEVEAGFVARVTAAAERWAKPPDFLPVALNDETEPAYNTRVAGQNGLRLFDGVLGRPAGAHSSLEFCDLMDEQRRIIHVKRRKRSSTLSHLFGQGLVSAETFLRDATYRADLCQKLHEQGRDNDIVLIPAERPKSAEWEVVYAIVGVNAADTPASLPFFSQLNFTIAAERLDSLGFGVSLRLVPVG